jgi:hypothetical protein
MGMVAQLTLSIADFGLRIAEFKNNNPKLSCGLPPFGRVPGFEIRNYFPMLYALCPMQIFHLKKN